MNHTTVKQYLKHYGKIRALRGSVMRSTFKRVVAAYDDYDESKVCSALLELGQNLDRLTCVYCSADATCWDHLVPASAGGTHQIRNLAPSCTRCNNEKGAKSWKTYLDQRQLDNGCAVWAKLEKHTADYQSGQTILENGEDIELDRILNEIHKLMVEADLHVESALSKWRDKASEKFTHV